MEVLALDFYCCAGGASMGLYKAGFNVIGVDIEPQPEYPFKFIQADVIKSGRDLIKEFNPDILWLSPPCQAYSFAAGKSRNLGKEYPDLVKPSRDIAIESGLPFIIENVIEAPLRKDLILCGEMFGLKVIRHRKFEVQGFNINQPEHKKHRGTVKDGYYCTVAGHGGDGKASLKAWQEAMDIYWIRDKKKLAQAVPPAYSNYIAEEFKRNTFKKIA